MCTNCVERRSTEGMMRLQKNFDTSFKLTSFNMPSGLSYMLYASVKFKEDKYTDWIFYGKDKQSLNWTDNFAMLKPLCVLIKDYGTVKDLFVIGLVELLNKLNIYHSFVCIYICICNLPIGIRTKLTKPFTLSWPGAIPLYI